MNSRIVQLTSLVIWWICNYTANRRLVKYVSDCPENRLLTLSPISSINIAGSIISLSETVITLGVTLDQTLNLCININKLCKSSYYHICALRHIRSSLPDDVCLSLATVLIHSRLDYCNSVMHGVSASNLNKFQVIQNALARTVSRSPSSVSASHLLSNLHWLPVRKRIDFKIPTLTYKVLSTQQPAYLHNLILYHQPSCVPRSSSQLILEVPRTKTEFGRRAFSSASSQIWNDIPLPVRYSPSLDSFKRHLKTCLFTCP